MLIFRPHQREPRIVDLDAAPWIADVEFVLRGPAERVPGFLSIQHAGAVHRCVAFVLRDRANHPLNVAATIAWETRRCGATWEAPPPVWGPSGPMLYSSQNPSCGTDGVFLASRTGPSRFARSGAYPHRAPDAHSMNGPRGQRRGARFC